MATTIVKSHKRAGRVVKAHKRSLMGRVGAANLKSKLLDKLHNLPGKHKALKKKLDSKGADVNNLYWKVRSRRPE